MTTRQRTSRRRGLDERAPRHCCHWRWPGGSRDELRTRRRGPEHIVLSGGGWAALRRERWVRFVSSSRTGSSGPGLRLLRRRPEGFAHYTDIVRSSISTPSHQGGGPRGNRGRRAGGHQRRGGFDVSSARVPSSTVGGGRHRPVPAHQLIPVVAQGVPPSVYRTDPTRYRGPGDLPAGAVLVVAVAHPVPDRRRAAHAGRRVYLSVSRHRRVPRRHGRGRVLVARQAGPASPDHRRFPSHRGRRPPSSPGSTAVMTSVLPWLAAAGSRSSAAPWVPRTATYVRPGRHADTRRGRRVVRRVHGGGPELAATGVGEELTGEGDATGVPLPRVIDQVEAVNVARNKIATVIRRSGFQVRVIDSMRLPVFDFSRGRPVQTAAVSAIVPGLYFLGLHWMHHVQVPACSIGRGCRRAVLAEPHGTIDVTPPTSIAPVQPASVYERGQPETDGRRSNSPRSLWSPASPADGQRETAARC